jgi:hypothetical protein
MGFGLVIGFIDLLQNVNAIISSAIATLLTLQFTAAHT